MASVAGLLLCDLVWADPISQNHTILGVFTRLRVSKVPTPMREISAYALVVGDPGEQGEIVLTGQEEATGEVVYQDQAQLLIGETGKTHLHVRFGKFSFPRTGSFRFSLMFNGTLIADQLLTVMLKEVQ